VNIDLAATTGFNDRSGFFNFMLVHRFVHEQAAAAISAKFGVPFSTFGLSSRLAEEAVAELMAQGKPGQRAPAGLQDWLKVHADIHVQSYTLLGQSPTVAPDLSQVDFGSSDQYYDWMYVHQQMHDFEYQQLGLT
jgi:hypothetical protein